MNTIIKRIEKLEAVIKPGEPEEKDYETWTDEQIQHRIAELIYMGMDDPGMTEEEYISMFMALSYDEKTEIEDCSTAKIIYSELDNLNAPPEVQKMTEEEFTAMYLEMDREERYNKYSGPLYKLLTGKFLRGSRNER